jgi:hypothetical protein
MKVFKITMKYCPVTASVEGWEMVFPEEFENREKAEQFLEENKEKILSPTMRTFGFARRMLFKIEEENNGKEEA